MPHHVNPTPERTATAPYNFVPLPQKVFTVEDGIDVGGEKIKPWMRNAEYIPGTSSGWIDLDITTLTPLYIRGPATRKDGHWDDRDSRLRPGPYTAPNGTPVIPGSSLRGMVRNLVEILAFSKIQPVSEARPFFRTVADDRIGRAYRSRLIRAGRKPRAGILRIQNETPRIAPCELLRVERSMLRAQGVPFQGGPNYTPSWPQQHGRCWVRATAGSENVAEIRIEEGEPAGGNWTLGTLVLTGNAPKKRREFVFLGPVQDTSTYVDIPEAIWNRFRDEDQITQWQEKAFPKDRPTNRSRRASGHLRDGEPIFFLTKDNGDLLFLGRAQMFRFPYDLSPADLVPDAIRNAALDVAEAMFGRVGPGSGTTAKALKGRVYFEDAVATGSPPTDGWLQSVLVPRILSAPKPTTFQHYLTQDGTQGPRELTTYLEGDHTTIRGHKLYWHRWDDTKGLQEVREPERHDEILSDLTQGRAGTDTQHTIIQPVRQDVRFRGRIRFENLNHVEVGALLSALALPVGCAHKLGMAKALGLGSLRITAQLELIDRVARYASWECDGIAPDTGVRFVKAFTDAMVAHARQSNETTLEGGEGLHSIARLDALFRLLEWGNRPPPAKTRQIALDDFRARPVLPTPHAVAGLPEPPWPSDPPRPGQSAGSIPRQESRPSAVSAPRSAEQQPEASRRVQKGQTCLGTLHRSSNGWVARFKSEERDAAVLNAATVPEVSDGTSAEFYITEQSKRGGIKARFERLLSA